MKKLNEYMSIKQASEFLGVTPNTLRNWDRANKVKACRNPQNRYRLYDKEELAYMLNNVRSKLAP